MNASRDDNEGNGDCSDAFDFFALLFVFFASGEFLAANNEDAGDGVDEAMGSITRDGE